MEQPTDLRVVQRAEATKHPVPGREAGTPFAPIGRDWATCVN